MPLLMGGGKKAQRCMHIPVHQLDACDILVVYKVWVPTGELEVVQYLELSFARSRLGCCSGVGLFS